ncbi:serine/arginine-rich splicing factor 11 isoform X2 [Syngnathoides biaculeatus]|uniref:serine/arginine-rich splicing factor 11 isoform X2 n=1 Tax=Syngnathoides biaculeatus TaxID=300417 RepID=UPI002ADDCADB|nr:serine/arginine-rich splicing factor 11 isoform X2 [Syngnathoides biaculeatus]
MNSSTHVIQVTNVSPSTTSEQMRTLFGFLGNIEELKLFPPDDSPMPVTSRVCFVKFLESESVGVSQHLTNTVFVDRALIVVPFAEGVIPDESKAMSLLAPANAVAGMMPGGGLLPTPNPLSSVGGTSFGGLGAPNLEQMAAMGIGPNMNPQALSTDFLKLIQSMDPKLNPLAAGLNPNPGLKNDSSNKEIEEAMKRVREAQSLISAAIEPGSKKDDKRKRSRSRSRRRRSRSRSRHRRSHSRSRRRSRSRNRRRSKSPRRRRSHSRDRTRRSRSRDRKEEKSKKRSKTPPKSYSSARRSRSVNRRHRRSRSVSRSPKKHLTRSPSPRRHKKEKKKDKDREKERDREKREHRDQSRDQRERSSRKRSRDNERDRKSDSEKGDVKVTRDYDEEEQGYGSEKEMDEEDDDDDERKSDSDSASSPKGLDEMGRGRGPAHKKSKINGDDHHQEDMEMSD